MPIAVLILCGQHVMWRNCELEKDSLHHACLGSSLALSSSLNPREVSLGAFCSHLPAYFPKPVMAQAMEGRAGRGRQEVEPRYTRSLHTLLGCYSSEHSWKIVGSPACFNRIFKNRNIFQDSVSKIRVLRHPTLPRMLKEMRKGFHTQVHREILG